MSLSPFARSIKSFFPAAPIEPPTFSFSIPHHHKQKTLHTLETLELSQLHDSKQRVKLAALKNKHTLSDIRAHIKVSFKQQPMKPLELEVVNVLR